MPIRIPQPQPAYFRNTNRYESSKSINSCYYPVLRFYHYRFESYLVCILLAMLVYIYEDRNPDQSILHIDCIGG